LRSPLLALLLLLGGAAQARAQAEELRFISCPIYRDTDAGRKSGCWLADEHASGIRFDVTRSPTKPDWNYEVLVEGRVAPQVTGNCGGVVLDPVRVSVVTSGGCPRHMLPAEEFTGDKFVLPPRNVRPLSADRPVPQQPFTDKTFHILYDFNSDFLVYQLSDYLFDEAVTYIRGVNPRAVVVTGWAATERAVLSDREIAEEPEIARNRAERIAESLARMGVSREIIDVRWKTAAEPVAAEGADGLLEPSRRRVDIEVKL
jgi:outer membrane protein OmpA-like peptidoglycan-associated protein